MSDGVNRELDRQLRDLGVALAEVGAPADLEARILANVASRRARQDRWRAVAGFALAAAVLLAALLWPRQPVAETPVAAAPEAVFYPLTAAGWDMRSEPASVIRVRLRRGELRWLGFPVSPDAVNTAVVADVVVGQDGTPRAVRIVE